MSDEPTGTGGVTPTEPMTPTATVTTPQTDATSGSTTTTAIPSLEDVQKELESLKNALKKANAEAKEHRLKANELDKLKADAEAEKLSETEKLQKQLADLQKERDASVLAAQEQKISAEIRIRALAAGVKEERLNMVTRLIDTKDIVLDDGSPTNIKDLMDALLKDMPELVGKAVTPTPTAGGATNPGRTQSSTLPEINWEVIGRLTPGNDGMYKDSQTGALYNPADISRWQLNNPQRYGQVRRRT